eukprot:jgi/Ulvmu1/12476/UM009_0128.1
MTLCSMIKLASCSTIHSRVRKPRHNVSCRARIHVMGLQQTSLRNGRTKTVPPCVYSSPREESQDLPEAAIAFKHQHMAACIKDTPISPFLLDSADVDHLSVSIWEVAVSKLYIEEPRVSRARHEICLADSEPDNVRQHMARSVAAIARLMSACALPSPWEAVNMLKMKPEILQLTESDLIMRIMALRKVLRRADLSTILRRKPGYLIDSSVDRRIEHALAVMAKLMPHVDVEVGLREQDQLWWTFQSLVEAPQSNRPL